MTRGKISATMAIALGEARQHGSLASWLGGFWTYDGCGYRDVGGKRVPDWYVGTSTIAALLKRGEFEVCERSRVAGLPIRVRIPAALKARAASGGMK